jgi:hypothetical protein
MASPVNITTPTEALRCRGCCSPMTRSGTRGPAKLRCPKCERLERKRVRRIKNGVAIPLGELIACSDCGDKIERTAGNRRFCVLCALKARQKRDRGRYHRKQGRTEPVAGIGSEAFCVGCSSPILKTRSDHVFCESCVMVRRNKINRETRERARRAAGIPVRSGVKINCKKCSREFVRRATQQKYCNACHNEPRITNHRRRLKTDMAFALNLRIGRWIRKSLGTAKAGRHWETLVGYTVTDLMRHLESLFVDGMSWENRGTWHIDHCKPLAMFSFSAPSDPEFKAAWALSNLQPLWALDNLRKGAKYSSAHHEASV